MANVWAPYAGQWNKDGYFGWTHVLPQISSLADMLAKLKAAFPDVAEGSVKEGEADKYGGPVQKLGIVAHGDQGGLVQLPANNGDGQNLTIETLPNYKSDLLKLARYLTPNAFLVFVSCTAGQGSRGDVLLNALSTLLRNRTIVGFEVFGLMGQQGANIPGTVIAVDRDHKETILIDTTPGLRRLQRETEYPGGGTRRLDEYGVFAKWSLNGAIKRVGKLEQGKRLKNLCANPACYGHAFAGERCKTIDFGPAPEILSKDFKPNPPKTSVPPRSSTKNPAGHPGVSGVGTSRKQFGRD